MYFLPFSLYLSGNKIYEIHLRTMKNTHETDLIQFFASCQYISIKVDLCLHFIGLVCPEMTVEVNLLSSYMFCQPDGILIYFPK